MNWEDLSKLFVANKEIIWLNNCGTTPASSRVVEEVNRFLKGYALKSVFTDAKDYVKTSKRIKEILGNLLKCSPDELALIHNTSEGMNFISYGLNLKKGDTILILENEYPSNVYPWEHWTKKGVHLKKVSVPATPDRFLEAFKKALDDKVKLVSFSTVHWCTGMPLPMTEVSKECKKRKIPLVLDGAQGVGHTEIDLSRLDVTAMAFPAWKWLTGPLGLGVLYVNQKKINKIDFVFKGQNSVENADDYLPYKKKLKKGASRYEFSTPSFTDWVYFETALEVLNRFGFKNIQRRNFELADYLCKRLKENGFSLMKDSFPDTKTAIIVFEKKGIPSEKIIRTLQKHKVYGALRLGRIRLSVHSYNTHKQIDKVIEILKTLI